MNMNLSVLEPYFGLQISQPFKILEKGFCIKNLCMDLNFQEKKVVCLIHFWVVEILNKLDAPCISYQLNCFW